MNTSATPALLERLNQVSEPVEVPILGKLILLLPITDGHDALVSAWRAAAEKMGYGAKPHHPKNDDYANYWKTFVDHVAASILNQMTPRSA